MSHYQGTNFIAIRLDDTSSSLDDALFGLQSEDVSKAVPLRSQIAAEIARVAEPGERWLVLQTIAVYDTAEVPQPKVTTQLSVEYK
jgi:hypothetical protein